MIRFLIRRIAAAGMVILAAAPLRAELTATETWQGLVAYYADSGRGVAARAEERAEGLLTLRDVTITGSRGGDGSKVTVPELQLRELEDGRVEITLSGRVSMTRGTDAPVVVTQKGARVVASGNRDDVTYDLTVSEIAIRRENDRPRGGDEVAMALTLRDGTGRARRSGKTTRMIDGEARFASAAIDLQRPAAAPDEPSLNLVGTLNDIRVRSESQASGTPDPSDPPAVLAAGYRAESTITFASGNVTADIFDATGAASVQTGLADGEITTALSRDGMRYTMVTGPSKVLVQVPSLSLPAEFGFDAVRLAYSGPAVSTAAPAPFAAKFNLGGLNLSDGLWALVDPAATLPREPMVLNLDIGGGVRAPDTLKSETDDTAASQAAEISDVTLNDLTVSGLGAKATAKGQAKIDNSGPAPRPVGSVDLQLEGLNGLIDRLLEMNLMLPEQAFGLRLTLALFTVAVGEDRATSRIEADAEGDVRVNGQVLYRFPGR